jgi:hypothetical protein
LQAVRPSTVQLAWLCVHVDRGWVPLARVRRPLTPTTAERRLSRTWPTQRPPSARHRPTTRWQTCCAPRSVGAPGLKSARKIGHLPSCPAGIKGRSRCRC